MSRRCRYCAGVVDVEVWGTWQPGGAGIPCAEGLWMTKDVFNTKHTTLNGMVKRVMTQLESPRWAAAEQHKGPGWTEVEESHYNIPGQKRCTWVSRLTATTWGDYHCWVERVAMLEQDIGVMSVRSGAALAKGARIHSFLGLIVKRHNQQGAVKFGNVLLSSSCDFAGLGRWLHRQMHQVLQERGPRLLTAPMDITKTIQGLLRSGWLHRVEGRRTLPYLPYLQRRGVATPTTALVSRKGVMLCWTRFRDGTLVISSQGKHVRKFNSDFKARARRFSASIASKSDAMAMCLQAVLHIHRNRIFAKPEPPPEASPLLAMTCHPRSVHLWPVAYARLIMGLSSTPAIAALATQEVVLTFQNFDCPVARSEAAPFACHPMCGALAHHNASPLLRQARECVLGIVATSLRRWQHRHHGEKRQTKVVANAWTITCFEMAERMRMRRTTRSTRQTASTTKTKTAGMTHGTAGIDKPRRMSISTMGPTTHELTMTADAQATAGRRENRTCVDNVENDTAGSKDNDDDEAHNQYVRFLVSVILEKVIYPCKTRKARVHDVFAAELSMDERWSGPLAWSFNRRFENVRPARIRRLAHVAPILVGRPERNLVAFPGATADQHQCG